MPRINEKNPTNSVRSEIIERAKKRRLLKWKKYFYIFSASFVLLFALLSFLSHQSFLAISDIVVEGEMSINENEIIDFVERETKEKYLFLFSKKNIFLFPRRQLEESLAHDFQRIKNINLSFSDQRVLHIDIKERDGDFLWCGDNAQDFSQAFVNPCFFVDNKGLVFDEAPFFSGPVYFTFYTNIDTRKSDAGIGSLLLEESIFNQIISSIDTLRSYGILARGVILKEKDVFEFVIGEGLYDSGRIIIKNTNLEESFQNLFSALSVSPLKESYENDFKDLLYVDVRFDDRVVYKFK